MRVVGLLVAGALLLVAALPASAQPVVLTFEGLPNFQAVGEHYDGGGGGHLGVTFTGPVTSISFFTGRTSRDPLRRPHHHARAAAGGTTGAA